MNRITRGFDISNLSLNQTRCGEGCGKAKANLLPRFLFHLNRLLQPRKIPTSFPLASNIRKRANAGALASALMNPTAGEKQIVILVAQGRTNREIADKLGLAEQTVRNYLSEIYAKTENKNRVELTLFAVRAGWVEAAGEK